SMRREFVMLSVNFEDLAHLSGSARDTRRGVVMVGVMVYSPLSRSMRRVKNIIKMTSTGKKNSDSVAPIPKRWAPPSAMLYDKTGKIMVRSAGPPFVKI